MDRDGRLFARARKRGRGGRWARCRAALLLAALGPSLAWAEDLERRRLERPDDPISLLAGSSDSWSVSNTAAGCYLLSPQRQGSSRLAIGRHPTLGLGVFAIGFPLSTAGIDAGEAIGIQAAAEGLSKVGRMAAAGLLFAPLESGEIQATLQELQNAGTLWVTVRRASIAHGGKDVGAGVAGFQRTCGDATTPAMADAAARAGSDH